MTTLRERIFDRASDRCEYCLLPQAATVLPHELDHIVAVQHGGQAGEDNLCLACALCNARKGPNLSGIDPLTQRLTRLFHPRIDRCIEHFNWQNATLLGLTDVGRTTVVVLGINAPQRVAMRAALILSGDFLAAR